MKRLPVRVWIGWLLILISLLLLLWGIFPFEQKNGARCAFFRTICNYQLSTRHFQMSFTGCEATYQRWTRGLFRGFTWLLLVSAFGACVPPASQAPPPYSSIAT